MKVRVIKEMPFAKVGEVFDVIGGDTIFITIKGEHAKVCYLVCGLIEDGWVEEVHILEDKLDQIPDENCTDCIKKTVKVVKEHYLEVFDKAFKDFMDDVAWGKAFKEYINRGRKALEEV